MSVRSAARGNPAAKSIRFALRTSSIVATSSANFSRCVLRWLGSRRLRSALMLSAIRVRPSTTQVLGPLKAKSLNHTPTPAVNPDLSETDGWQGGLAVRSLAGRLSGRRRFGEQSELECHGMLLRGTEVLFGRLS